MKVLVRGATVIAPGVSMARPMDVLCEDGKVRAIEPLLPSGDAQIIQADGLYCTAGLVDMHVHLRDPGQTYKEDIFSGCEAAAAGGVTSVACMPNTTPAVDSPAVLREILEKAQTAKARVYPVAAVTAGLQGEELNNFMLLKEAGAAAVSDDGRPVPTAGLMQRAMQLAAEAGLPILSHSEELSLVRGGIMNAGVVAQELGVRGICAAAEEVAVAREVALAAATGCPVHICHVSTAGSVALIRDARRRGVRVTAETAPHYFALTEECLRSRDADYRMNPPLRTEQDVQAVIEGLRDGTLTVIATDHAPHSAEDKADFLTAPNGVVGLETSLAAGITYLVKPGYLTLRRLLELMAAEPARILGIPGGVLEVGGPADLMVFDPHEEWTVRPERLHSKSKNSAFKGMALTGRVKATVCRGDVVYRDV